MNTYFESIVYPAIHSATDTDAMYQYTDQAYLWQEKVRESMAEGGGGIKAAFEWRDAPWLVLTLAGVAVLAIGLLWFAEQRAMQPGERYVPARLEGGQITEGGRSN